MINANNIFSLFNPDDRNAEEESLLDFDNHPHILVGFFTRMILRGDSFNKELSTLITANTQADVDTMLELNKLLIYNRAFEYLERVDLNKKEHQEYLSGKIDTGFITASNRALEYYIALEHYEKCSHIKKIQDFITFSQKKLPL